ncbi:MAG: hypothetical protein COT74_03370 [Bdellovibrionales bacterium CG10_big_fil_rev_8_21_14_0_10_45_34]|nr:MAG: hypothetical protein COT74_03370 [Bdellovibrionales bacterium CG10_big_fil_rev_8_21_14_0_10_45_34]
MSELYHQLERVNFSKGEVLFKEGEAGYFFYILQEGAAEVFKTTPSGQEKRLGVVRAGQPLGEFALITQSPRSASARATDNGYAIKISSDAYEKLLAELPEWAMSVLESLVDRLKSANDLLAQFSDRIDDGDRFGKTIRERISQ